MPPFLCYNGYMVKEAKFPNRFVEYELKYPLDLSEGNKLTKLKLEVPTTRQVASVTQDKNRSELDMMTELVALISVEPRLTTDQVSQIKFPDMKAIMVECSDFLL